jgi:hypothetical protein
MNSVFENGGIIGPARSFKASPIGEEEYITPGTYSWTAPEGVTSVCVVCVGAGGGPAGNTNGGAGAGGGGLGWKNNIPVIPGQSYAVVVGAGGGRVTSGTAPAGGDSYFINTSTVAGLGGGGGVAGTTAVFGAGGGFVGDGGGNGGNGGERGSTASAGGGGGAGGYSGNGGDGSAGTVTTGLAQSGSGGGGGGGGAAGSADSAGSGGGVGIYGEGPSGSGGANSTDDGGSGFGGSGGEDGNFATTTAPENIYGTSNRSTPGRFGGGGAGADNTTNEQAPGAGGAVRIIWGDDRVFPSTNVEKDFVDNRNKTNSGIWLLRSVIDSLFNPPNIVFIESIDFASTSTTILGPTIPNYVDDTYIGVLMEYTSSLSGSSAAPSGWTQFFTEPLTYTTSAGLSICYKILSESDRGTSPGALVGGNQRDQLFIFKNLNGKIKQITQGNFQASSASGTLSANAPEIRSSSESALAIHYFYNSTTSNPTVSMTPPADALVRSTANNLHGGQYKIYNSGSIPVNTTSSATLAGTIRQALFWLVIE